MRTKPDFGDLMVAHLKSLAVPDTPEVIASRVESNARHAEEAQRRRQRTEAACKVLNPGTLVKVEISWLRDHVLIVASDRGPASDMRRKVLVRRREDERYDETYQVCRDRMQVITPDNSISASTVGGTPMPGDLTGTADAGLSGNDDKVATND